jgi:hypothetical protein
LIDQLQAYSPHTNPIYYTTIFIDGLCGDIKFLIVVQRLKDLDTAYYLALLQEETTSSHGKTYKIADVGGGGGSHRSPFSGELYLFKSLNCNRNLIIYLMTRASSLARVTQLRISCKP